MKGALCALLGMIYVFLYQAISSLCLRQHLPPPYLTSNRSASITLAHESMKSVINFSLASSQAYTSDKARSSEFELNTRSTRLAVYMTLTVSRSLPSNSSAISDVGFKSILISVRLTIKSFASDPDLSVNTPF